MDSLFDRLPYDELAKIKFAHLLGGAFGVGLSLFAAFYFTLYSSLQDEFAERKKERDTAQQKLRNDQRTIAEKKRIHTNLVTLEGELFQVKRQMPRRKDIAGFLKQVSDLGVAMGLEVLLIERQPEQTKDFYKVIPIKIQVEGGFYMTVGFFDAIQNLLRLIDITDLNMESKTKSGGEGKKQKSVTTQTSSMAVTYSYINGSEEPKEPPAET